MTLPLLLSAPHIGLAVPPEAEPYCQLSETEIIQDGDEGAAEIYDLAGDVAQYATTDVARAIVDLNRAEDDRRPDGVVKTHTCWNVPVYREFPPPEIIKTLLTRYYHPYHARLSELSRLAAGAQSSSPIKLAVDCHTMAAVAPPIAPDPGQTRPAVCLGDVGGQTLPAGWMSKLLICFQEAFGDDVTVNQPFSGGYITRTHGREMPWVQLELSRGPFLTNQQKRTRVLQALTQFCETEIR